LAESCCALEYLLVHKADELFNAKAMPSFYKCVLLMPFSGVFSYIHVDAQ